MLEPEFRTELAKRVRALQIIVAALVFGSAVFLALTLILPSTGLENDGEPSWMLTGILLAAAALGLTARAVVPSLLERTLVAQVVAGKLDTPSQNREFFEQHGDPARLCAAYSIRTIVAGALVEGAAFMACAAYLLEGHLIALVAAGLLIAILVADLPRCQRAEAWIEEKLREVAQQRSLQGE